jgi:hypothetical protein
MSGAQRVVGLKNLARLVAGALTGRLGLGAMVLGYSFCAVVLLAYVLTQVYTFSLMEDVVKRERDLRDLKEKIGLQTQRYVELASRARISRICETRLGMVQIQTGQLVRISIESRMSNESRRGDSRGKSIDLPGAVGEDIDAITEVWRR